MTYYTSNTYQLKREILNFSKKLSHSLPKPQRKFSADMTYGILASQSCLLTDIADSLLEPSKKINVVAACLPIWNAEFLIHYGTITAVLLNTGLLLSPLFTSMIPMLSNPMVTNLRLWGLFVMVLKVPLLKMFIKKAIMLRRLAS